MIVVRNVFQLKFGKSRDALALWREGREIIRRAGLPGGAARVLTDLAGPYYTLVIEHEFPSAAEWEAQSHQAMQHPEWQAWYQRFSPLVESGHREMFNLVE
jgi:hypothetical protein